MKVVLDRDERNKYEMRGNITQERGSLEAKKAKMNQMMPYGHANITFLLWIYDGGTYKSRLLREKYIKEMDETERKKEQRNVSKK